MSEKIDTAEKHEPGLTSLSEDDLDNVAGGGKSYYRITHMTGCEGTFSCDIPEPPYCLLCGGPMYW